MDRHASKNAEGSALESKGSISGTGTVQKMKRFVLFALYLGRTWSVCPRFYFQVDGQKIIYSYRSGFLQTGNKSISACKSLKKILSYIVGDYPCLTDK